jgi:hypothetical protein
MQQNLNPMERKNAARGSKPEISEMVSRQRHLGAGSCRLFFGARWELLGVAGSTSVPRPQLKTQFKTFLTQWTDVTVEKWPSPTFWRKITKALDRKLADGRQ